MREKLYVKSFRLATEAKLPTQYPDEPLLFILSVFAYGCASTAVTPRMTQLQIREFQARPDEINDTKLVMKAMLNVLQDDGLSSRMPWWI